MAAKKKAAKKAAKKTKVKAEKAPRAPFGSEMRITKVNDNPLREGGGAHARYGEMAAFLKKKPTATVADVIAGTSYGAKDLRRDKRRGHIVVK